MVLKIALTKDDIDSLFYLRDFWIQFTDEVLNDMPEEPQDNELDHADDMLDINCLLNRIVALVKNQMLIEKEKNNHSSIPSSNMTPTEFSKFVRQWMNDHLDDEELAPGYVERMFSSPLETYRMNLKHSLQK